MDDNSKYTGAYADLLTQIAENVEAVYAAGVKSEYDRFWDEFQNYGEQVTYRNCFKSTGWNDITFKPKYTIKPSGSHDYMFSTADMSRIDEGVLDLSDCNSIVGLFQLATNLIYVAPLDLKTITGDFNYMFQSCSKLETVTLNNIPDNGKDFRYAFQSCSSLINLTVTGTIGQNIDLHWSTKLTHESLMSIINALKDFSGTGTTRTCTLGEANLAKLTDTEKAIATEKGWTLA